MSLTLAERQAALVADPDRAPQANDPFCTEAELNQRCKRCGHRYGSHSDKGCRFAGCMLPGHRCRGFVK